MGKKWLADFVCLWGWALFGSGHILLQ